MVERQPLRQQQLDPTDHAVGAFEPQRRRLCRRARRPCSTSSSRDRAGRVPQDRDDVLDRLGRRVGAHRGRDRDQARRPCRCRGVEPAPYVKPFCSRSTVLIRDEKLPPIAKLAANMPGQRSSARVMPGAAEPQRRLRSVRPVDQHAAAPDRRLTGPVATTSTRSSPAPRPGVERVGRRAPPASRSAKSPATIRVARRGSRWRSSERDHVVAAHRGDRLGGTAHRTAARWSPNSAAFSCSTATCCG